MIAAIFAVCAVVLVLGIALVFERRATMRAKDLALIEIAKSVDASIREETQKRIGEEAKKAAEYEAKIPALSDPELEAEINK